MAKHLPSLTTSPKVDIVIPVYKDLAATRRCIESVLAAQCKTNYCLIIVNDASPEPEIETYLKNLVNTGNIILIENKENKGFVCSVNIGMQQHLQRDVILLNSDTVVVNDWLDRLYRCAHSDDSIATVTPFSNNATICSYPKTCEENELPLDYSLPELDTLFASNNTSQCLDIPTAVGFCMFIKRDCLNQIGYFDELRFGKGYGEENDFCLRAQKRGWRHVIACDVFVYHQGSVSFGEAKLQLIENARKILQKSYPNYALNVRKFIAQDPLAIFRQRIDVSRLQKSKRCTYLFILHEGEGGVVKHVRDLIRNFNIQANFLLLHPEDNFRIKLLWANEGEVLTLYFRYNQPDLLLSFLKTLNISRIHLHHSLGWKDIVALILQSLPIPYDITIHDYYLFCPQVSLTTKQGAFCGLPDSADCQKCVDDRWSSRGINIVEWRKNNQSLLENAQRVFVPTQSVLQIIQNYFPQVNYIVTPHLETENVSNFLPFLRSCAVNEPLKILLLGGLSQIKGADILLHCAKWAKQHKQPLEFHLIGYPYRKFSTHSHLIIHGRYAEADLENLINKINPHIAWFPALWPETYSYTLSACFKAALPIVSSDLGAQAERLMGRKYSFVRPWQTTPQEWNRFFLEFKQNPERLIPAPQQINSVNRADFSYVDNYLIPRDTISLEESPELSSILTEIAATKFYSLKRTLRVFKRKVYFFMLLCYSKLGFEYLLPRKSVFFMRGFLQKMLLAKN